MHTNDETYKETLVAEISDLFLKYGLRSTSMDDMASHLNISKKTLYQYFTNKDDVVEQVMIHRHELLRHHADLQELMQKNAIEIVQQLKHFLAKEFNSRIPANWYDIKKYHPAVYKKLTEEEEKAKQGFLEILLDKGISEGYFRKDIDKKLQIYLLSTPLTYLGDPELISRLEYPVYTIVCTVLDNFVRAIATEKGLKEIERQQ